MLHTEPRTPRPEKIKNYDPPEVLNGESFIKNRENPNQQKNNLSGNQRMMKQF